MIEVCPLAGECIGCKAHSRAAGARAENYDFEQWLEWYVTNFQVAAESNVCAKHEIEVAAELVRRDKPEPPPKYDDMHDGRYL